MKTLFIRALKAEDKEVALREAVSATSRGEKCEGVFSLDPAAFSQVPNSPFAYWVDDEIRGLFKKFPPFESEGRTVRQGLATADDFRFIRAWWEVPPEHRLDACNGPDWRAGLSAFQDWCHGRTHEEKYWAPFAKGGEYSPYYADIHLVVNWKNDGEEMKAFASSVIRNPDFFFRPGVTWPLRTQSGLGVRAFPAGCLFGHKGPAAFSENNGPHESLCMLGIATSGAFCYLVDLQMVFGSYEVGIIQKTPFPSISQKRLKELAAQTLRNWFEKVLSNHDDETTHVYRAAPSPDQNSTSIGNTGTNWNLYGVSGNPEVLPHEQEYESASEDEPVNLMYAASSPDNRMSQLLGLSFGRFDLRLALDPSLAPALADPFDPLPISPPAMLVGTDGFPARNDNIASEAWLRARPNAISLPPGPARYQKITAADYPIDVPWDGILVDDPDDERDIVKRLYAVLRALHGSEADAKERELLAELGTNDLREYLGKPARLFAEHLSRYSKSRRKAPIYWPLQTSDGRFTLWIYYPRLTQDTLFACINIVDRKLSLERRKLELSRNDLNETEGRNERVLVEQLEEFTAALSEMKEELELVTALPYKPDLDDGVMISASPLWRLFRHAPWQKELRSCWDKLEGGDFDWAHLAYAVWPDRVQKKCRKDRSLAIAHGLESICEQKPPEAKAKKGRKAGSAVAMPLDFEEDEG